MGMARPAAAPQAKFGRPAAQARYWRLASRACGREGGLRQVLAALRWLTKFAVCSCPGSGRRKARFAVLWPVMAVARDDGATFRRPRLSHVNRKEVSRDGTVIRARQHAHHLRPDDVRVRLPRTAHIVEAGWTGWYLQWAIKRRFSPRRGPSSRRRSASQKAYTAKL